MAQEKTVTINNIQINYQESGTGLPVLFGHSYLWDANMWTHQLAVLSKNYLCVVPHLFGHGKNATPLPHACQNLGDLADIYCQFMKGLGFNEFAVVGLSVGGMWGAHMAAKYPQHVVGAILMDTYLGAEYPDKKALYFSLIDRLKVEGITEQLGKELAPFFFKPNVEQKYIDLFVAQFLCHSRPEDIATMGHIIFDRADDLGLLDQIRTNGTPARVIVGAQDIPRPSFEAKEMAERLGSECMEIPNSGHIPVIEQPQACNTILERCLREMFEDAHIVEVCQTA